ncbi:MAG: phosphate ABC transporter ATP-binding protein, partial [Halobacteriales archaeon SW_8_66_22]
MSFQDNTTESTGPSTDSVVEPTAGVGGTETTPEADTIIESRDLNVYYNDTQALQDVSMEIPEQQVTALIGPSGCGKSTYLRCLNRMNDLIDAARVEGEVRFRGKNVYDDDVGPVALRRKIGMVFQEPNPFPKSIYDNVAYGLRVQGKDDDLDEKVETALRRA